MQQIKRLNNENKELAAVRKDKTKNDRSNEKLIPLVTLNFQNLFLLVGKLK